MYCLNTRMNFGGISPDRQHEFPRWISSAWYMSLEYLHEFYLNCLICDCCLSAWTNLLENLWYAWHAALIFEHLNCWIFSQFEFCMNSINIMNDEFDYCAASVTEVDFYMHTEYGVYLRPWNELCLWYDWCVNVGCVLSWYHILRELLAFCTVFSFLYNLHWQCHAIENSLTKVGNC